MAKCISNKIEGIEEEIINTLRILQFKDVFKFANKKESLKRMPQLLCDSILHFLFLKIDKLKAKRVFGDCFPIIDRKQRQVFSKACFEWFKTLRQEKKLLPTKAVKVAVRSDFEPNSIKFVHTLWELSVYAIQTQIYKADPSAATLLKIPDQNGNHDTFMNSIKSVTQDKCENYAESVNSRHKALQTLSDKAKFLHENYKNLQEKNSKLSETLEMCFKTHKHLSENEKLKLASISLENFKTEMLMKIEEKNNQVKNLMTENAPSICLINDCMKLISGVISRNIAPLCIDANELFRNTEEKAQHKDCFTDDKLDLIKFLTKLHERLSQQLEKQTKFDDQHGSEIKKSHDLSVKQKEKIQNLLSNVEKLTEHLEQILPKILASVDELDQKLGDDRLPALCYEDGFDVAPPNPFVTMKGEDMWSLAEPTKHPPTDDLFKNEININNSRDFHFYPIQEFTGNHSEDNLVENEDQLNFRNQVFRDPTKFLTQVSQHVIFNSTFAENSKIHEQKMAHPRLFGENFNFLGNFESLDISPFSQKGAKGIPNFDVFSPIEECQESDDFKTLLPPLFANSLKIKEKQLKIEISKNDNFVSEIGTLSNIITSTPYLDDDFIFNKRKSLMPRNATCTANDFFRTDEKNCDSFNILSPSRKNNFSESFSTLNSDLEVRNHFFQTDINMNNEVDFENSVISNDYFNVPKVGEQSCRPKEFKDNKKEESLNIKYKKFEGLNIKNSKNSFRSPKGKTFNSPKKNKLRRSKSWSSEDFKYIRSANDKSPKKEIFKSPQKEIFKSPKKENFRKRRNNPDASILEYEKSFAALEAALKE